MTTPPDHHPEYNHAGHGHGLPAGPSADELISGTEQSRKTVLRWILGILVPVTVLTVVGLILLWPTGQYKEFTLDDPYGTVEGFSIVSAQVVDTEPRDCMGQGQIMESSLGGSTDYTGTGLECQTAYVDTDGGGTDRIALDIPPEVTASATVEVGDRLKVLLMPDEPGYSEAVFVDFERTIPVTILMLAYVVVVIVVAGWRGVRSIIGLLASFAVIFGFMVPALLEGGPPMWIGLVGSNLIMVAVLYFAHGFSLRTTTALLGTMAGLALTAILAAWGTDAAYLIGLGEEYAYVLTSVAPEIKLSGIVLCGLLIAGLGVLNDVTITQSSAVWELQAANPGMSKRELFAAGMRIGKDHIASTVYTIAFAYTGAALTMLMVVFLYDRSFFDILVSAEMVEEVVRILIGSIGLVLAIPITTGIAVGVAKSVAETTAHPGVRPRGKRAH